MSPLNSSKEKSTILSTLLQKGLITFIQFFNSFIHLKLFKLTKTKTIFMITKKYLPIFMHFSFEKFTEFIGKIQMGKPQLSQLFCVPWAIEVHCFIFGDTWINNPKGHLYIALYVACCFTITCGKNNYLLKLQLEFPPFSSNKIL